MTEDNSNPPEKKTLRTKKFDVDKHAENIRVAAIVTESIRELQRMVGTRHHLYHTLQKYIDRMIYRKGQGVACLPFYDARCPKSSIQSKNQCLKSIACYLVLEYWEYQQGEDNVSNIELTQTYIKCLCDIGYKEIKVEGSISEGYYIWSDPTKQLDAF